jgi:signal transduction histidine kinase
VRDGLKYRYFWGQVSQTFSKPSQTGRAFTERALWVGTRGAGLLRWREGRVDTFTSRQGLLSDSIYAILEDEQGHLWFNSSRGIFRVSKVQFESLAQHRLGALACASYGKMDGVAASGQYREVTQPAACKALDGRLWFRSTHGVTVVDPNTTTNRLPPLVAIEQVLADQRLVVSNGPQTPARGNGPSPALTTQVVGRSVPERRSDSSGAHDASLVAHDDGPGRTALPQPFLPGQNPEPAQLLAPGSDAVPLIQLRPGRGELEVRYTALSLRAPEKNQFRYQLEGADPDWVEAGSRRVAYYNNLAPGTYTFRVAACNNDGVWNEAGAAVRLVLQPHPWQTWWFRGGCGLALVGAIGGTARYVTRRRLRPRLQQLEQQHDIESERGRIARDLHDNLGTRLTEILMLNEATWRHADGPAAKLKPQLEKAAALVRDLAGSLDAIVWAADPKNDTLDQFILYVYEYLDSLAQVGPRILRDVPAELPACPLSPAQRHNLFLVLKEALNNTFKHSGATELWFRLHLEADRLQLSLEDNGKGFVPTAVSQLGNGLVNMEKRLKLIGGTFAVESQPGAGTRVRLQMPLKQ